MTNEQKISAEELERIDQDGKKNYPDWYTEYDEGRAFHGYIRGARAEHLRHLNSKPFIQGPTGIQWRNAGKNLPHVKREIHFDYAFPGYPVARYVGSLIDYQPGKWFVSGGISFPEEKFKYIFWLDESTPALLEAKTETEDKITSNKS